MKNKDSIQQAHDLEYVSRQELKRTLTDEQTDRLDSIVEQIDSIAKSAEEYATSAEGSYADFVGSIGYGDGDIDLSRIDDDRVKEFLQSMSEKEQMTWLKQNDSCLSVESVGIHIVANEIFSVIVGEIEEQLPDDLTDELEKLTLAEACYVADEVDGCYLGNTSYIHVNCDYDRVVLVLDTDAAIEAIESENEKNMTLLMDESAGIYIPRNFYESFDFAKWNLNQADFSELADPDHENYWDSWLDLLSMAKHTDAAGLKWTLYQDGDLWAVSEKHFDLKN
jgi:hypothetical protein